MSPRLPAYRPMVTWPNDDSWAPEATLTVPAPWLPTVNWLETIHCASFANVAEPLDPGAVASTAVPVCNSVSLSAASSTPVPEAPISSAVRVAEARSRNCRVPCDPCSLPR